MAASVARLFGSGKAKDPALLRDKISQEALDFVGEAFEGVGEVIDVHTHAAGVGHQATGCRIHPNFYSLLHPALYAKRLVLLSSSRVNPDSKTIDADFVSSLRKLIRGARPFPWGRHFLLALDYWYDTDGTQKPELTSLYVPNEYVVSLAERFPFEFIPGVSIHPYKANAVVELEHFAKQGVKLVKWHPNSMGINMTHQLCYPFFAKMREYKMVLLCYIGYEHTLNASGLEQHWGSPLYMKGPLDAGVRVIAAHCASEGDNIDLEDPKRGRVQNYELFLRMMDRPKYKGLLFGDISAVTMYSRVGAALTAILDRNDLHSRLVYGTDYPLPGANVLVHTSQLHRKNYITSNERTLLNEIFAYNPLLFDFALKRCVRSPTKGRSFAPEVFGRNLRDMGMDISPLSVLNISSGIVPPKMPSSICLSGV